MVDAFSPLHIEYRKWTGVQEQDADNSHEGVVRNGRILKLQDLWLKIDCLPFFILPNRMKFCQKCSYVLVLNCSNGDNVVWQECKNCGFKELLKPANETEAIILETNLRSGSSAGGASSGIAVNNYTLLDPTLPHIHSLTCPNAGCSSNKDESLRDVIYIKTDPTNLKFQYICTACHTQWTN